MIPLIPVDGKKLDWPRKVANAINALIGNSVKRSGETAYTAPTISDPPTKAEVQAIADALETISAQLK